MHEIPQGPQQPSALLAGDFIQARRCEPDEPYEVAEGIVASVDGSTVTMGTRTFNVSDGWELEVIRRDLPFPTTLAEINAVLRSTGETVLLMGKGEIWTTAAGTVIPTTDIRAFELAD